MDTKTQLYQRIGCHDPTIVSGQNDTVLVVQPDTPGDYSYTYQIIDDFGCVYDTSVSLYVLPQPTIFPDTFACDFWHIVNGTTSYAGGVWSATDTTIHFSPSVNVENPDIWTYGGSGIYTVTYTDNACNTEVSAEIDFLDYPGTWLSDTTLCMGETPTVVAPDNNNYPTIFEWSDGTLGPNLVVSEPGGTYIVTMTNACHTNYDTVTIDFKLCDIEAPNVLSLAQGSQNALWYVNADGLASFNLTITNRWGNVVYECFDSQAKCYWDGRNKNDTFVVPGTYFYTIDATSESGEPIVKHGFLQVVD